MNMIDVLVISLLIICVVWACFTLKDNKCNDCSKCHHKCGGKSDGR